VLFTNLGFYIHLYIHLFFYSLYIFSLYMLICLFQSFLFCMRSKTRAHNLLFDPEIERTTRRNNTRRRRRKEIQKVKEEKEATSTFEQVIFSSTDLEEEEMDGEGHGDRHVRRTLEDYASFSSPLNFSSIAQPVVNATNREMKPTLIHLV